jgi:hypothetical protein
MRASTADWTADDGLGVKPFVADHSNELGNFSDGSRAKLCEIKQRDPK